MRDSARKHRFPLWPHEVEAAQSWVEHDQRTPSKARYASSAVLLRDSVRGSQTILSYRRGVSPLGTVAFPGGSVEAADDAEIDWLGPSPSAWAKAMAMDDATLAGQHVVAAIRELFEETGILLAGADAASVVEVAPSAEWLATREALAAQKTTFSEVLFRRGLALRTDLLRPLMNWISPDFAHRRFNTWYFAAILPTNQAASALASKSAWLKWVCPGQLLAERQSTVLGDEIGAQNTTGRTLDQLISSGSALILARIAKSRGCIAYLNQRRPALAFQPRLVTENGELWLEVDTPIGSESVCRER